MSEDLKPTLTTVDVQRGCKEIAIFLKSGEERSITVKAPGWESVAQIHLENGPDQMKVERRLLEEALPPHLGTGCDDAGPILNWLEWLDIESRNHVSRVVREFAYGFATEKKRAAALAEISKLYLSARRRQPPNASGSDSATPSPGAVPSSPSSPDASAGSKPTTA